MRLGYIKLMYKNVENSETYHFQLKSPKKTQTGLKTQTLSLCQFNSGQMKHNLKKLKEAFVKHISIVIPRPGKPNFVITGDM